MGKDPLFEKLEDTEETIGPYLRKIHIALIHENYSGAKAVIDEYVANTSPDAITLNDSPSLILPLRSANALEVQGYKTIRSIIDGDPLEMIKYPQVGVNMMVEIIQACSRIGIPLGKKFKAWQANNKEMLNKRMGVVEDRPLVKIL